ncbi:MAG: fructose-1,6-bisphosphate aldolase [Elusimicrobia bacterium RIFOXYA2_FULL_50_26]|nr:MAG: fructose-1,6-bisphosphate aldolase [Elusimicrobia bacterium RIFOXYA2_FULL_50_26]OGS24966.1 MAG: fructose-1,6-bisphosphate aldolase [Elusimicrobia bacterium RIFOXYB2_FULL_50_12]
MSLTPMKQILDEARKKGYGVGAYNVNNMEQIQAIMAAAQKTKSPVIIQASRGALKYSNFTYLKHLMIAAAEENPNIPLAMHLDHGNSLETVKKAIDLGFTSVMIDGSLMEDGKTASDYDYNARVTRSVVEYSHKYGVTVEGEIGRLGGIEDGVGSGSIHLTDPDQAKKFVDETGLDALAIAIGTSHGAYKFKGAANLAIDVLKKVRALVDIPIVLHGASSVPIELIDKVNKYGGALPGATGVPMASLQEAIKLGVTKINVDTDGRLAVTAAIREVFATKPEKFDPRDYLGPAREALSEIIAGKMKDFGTAGHSDDYKSMSLEDMKKLYGK